MVRKDSWELVIKGTIFLAILGAIIVFCAAQFLVHVFNDALAPPSPEKGADSKQISK